MIDWDRVRELRDEIGADDFAEVVELFLEETDEVAKGIRNGIAPQDIESALHFLKGSALNLGFRGLANLCQTGEKAAASGRCESVDLGQILAVYEQAKAIFATHLNAEDAA